MSYVDYWDQSGNVPGTIQLFGNGSYLASATYGSPMTGFAEFGGFDGVVGWTADIYQGGVVVASGTFSSGTINLTWGSGGGSHTYTMRINFTNNSPFDKDYQVRDANTGQVLDHFTVGAGVTYNWTGTFDSKRDLLVVPVRTDPGTGVQTPNGNPTTINNTDSHWATDSGNNGAAARTDNPSVVAPLGPGTNGWFNIPWTDGTPGAWALDATVRQLGDTLYTTEAEGFGLLDQDTQSAARAMKAAADQAHSDWSQPAGYLSSISGSDAGIYTKLADMDLWVGPIWSNVLAINQNTAGILGALTNQNSGSTSNLLSQSTNLLSQINTGIGTNFDRLIKVLTNCPTQPDLAAQSNLGSAAKDEGKGLLQGVADGIHVPGDVAYTPDVSAFQIPFAVASHEWNVDCDPGHNVLVVNLASKIRAIIVWFIWLVFAASVTRELIEYLRAGAAAQQAHSAGTTVMGTNLNSAIALGVAAAITLCLFVLPATIAAFYVSECVGIFASNPFSGGGGAWGNTMYLVDMFVPVTYLIDMIAEWLAFRWSMAAVFWGAMTIIRFCVG